MEGLRSINEAMLERLELDQEIRSAWKIRSDQLWKLAHYAIISRQLGQVDNDLSYKTVSR